MDVRFFQAAAERFGSSRNARGSVPSSLPGEWQPRSPHPAPPASRWQGSRVASLFGGQLRLRLTCPRCGRQSITFDPFLCLSLPIPVPQQWLCRLSFVPRNAPPVSCCPFAGRALSHRRRSPLGRNLLLPETSGL